jgi:sirohydrochlorin cobaltochelatase
MSSSDETAIVLTAYGTLKPDALSTYHKIEDRYQREFPGCEIRLAFSSDLMRRRLAEKESVFIPSPFSALAEMRDCGAKDVVVQSLQIVPGNEFHKLASLLRGLRQVETGLGFQSLQLGLPLLAGLKDCRYVSKAVSSLIRENVAQDSDADLQSHRAIVLAGHGSGHPADSLYLTLAQILLERYKGVFAGTLEGYPSIEEVLKQLAIFQAKSVLIVPLFLVSGGHVMKDLAGESPDSWKSRVKRQGYSAEVICQGLGDREDICSIFMDHTREAMNNIPPRCYHL